MKLYAQIKTDTGKITGKGANEYIEITLSDTTPKYFIYFRENKLIVEDLRCIGGGIEVLRIERGQAK